MKHTLKTNTMSALLLLSSMMFLLSSCGNKEVAQNPLIGSWKPTRYILKDGSSKNVDGHIFFSKSQWSVVFFVLDAEGNPANGSAEGGEYELEGNQLTFQHLYNLSDIQKGATGEISKVLRNGEEEMPEEVCKIEFDEELLVIYFPSGNAMIFSPLI